MTRIKATSALLSVTLMPMLLLGQWLGLIGSISALDTTRDQAVAQTADASTDTAAENSADPSSPAAETASSSTAASKKPTSSKVSEESANAFFGVSTEAKDLVIPATDKPVSSTPTTAKSILPVLTPEQEAATQIISQATPNTASTPATASQSSATTQPEVAPDSATSAPIPAKKSTTSSPNSTDYSDAYVDPTDYSIGATQTKRNAANRPSVVLSERSTGCQTILSADQGVTANLCGSRTNQALKEVTSKSSNVTLSQPVTDSGSIQTGTLSSNGMTTPTRNLSQVASPGPIAGSVPLNRIRPSSRSSGWGNFAAGFNHYNNIKVTKWFAPSKTRLIFPLAIPAAITSAFGWRLHPIAGTWRFHAGTDLGAPMGTPVLAAYAGKVATANFLGGYGLAVVLNHNQNTQESLYGHLSEILVKPGAWVEQGDVIGRVGSTGNSTGPHLHFEFRQSTPEGWVTVDPGQQLETALAQLVRALQTAQASSQRTGT